MLIADEYCRIKMTGAAQFVGKVRSIVCLLAASSHMCTSRCLVHKPSARCRLHLLD